MVTQIKNNALKVLQMNMIKAVPPLPTYQNGLEITPLLLIAGIESIYLIF